MARILVITNMYPPHHLGGYELSCADVVDRWRERGHKVTVLTTTTRLPDVADPVGERERSDVRRDLTWYWDDHKLTSPPAWRRFLAERANQKAVGAAIEHCQPDVVSVWHMGALNLGLLTCFVHNGTPIVLNLLDEWLTYEQRLDGWTRLWRSRPRAGRLIAALTGVHTAVPDLSDVLHCFCSELTRQHCAEDPVWPCRRWEVTPLGLDRRDFPPLDPSAVAERERRSWEWRLLYVGRIDERKGMAAVIRALPLLPLQATVTFLGRGDQAHREELDRLAVSLGVADRVIFDAVPRPELAARYGAADVFLFPSEWAEPFGIVPLEAMACGTPVIATGVGGSAEFLEDGMNCLLFTKGDPSSLADAVVRLAGDADLRAKLVDGGLETADRLTTDRQAERLEHLHLVEAGLTPDAAWG